MNHYENLQSRVHRYHDGGVGRILGWTFIGIVVAFFFALVFGLVVKVLWNWIMPAVFGLAMITYWQAFGIILLSKILFSGIHPQRDHERHAPPFARRRPAYDRWWKEEGQAAFDSWAQERANENSPESDGAR